METQKIKALLVAIVAGFGCLVLPVRAQYVGPDAGQKVVFVGDSITFFYMGPEGWVGLVAQELEKKGKKIEVIGASYPGHTSRDLLANMKTVLGYKPDWMTLSCGVNDVFLGSPRGVELDEYKKNVTSMVDQATAAGIKVVILTPTPILEDQANVFNQKLAGYLDFLRSLAAERHLLIADLNAAMQKALVERKAQNPKLKGELLTKSADGIHPNSAGSEVMAAAVLKTFGFTDEELVKLKESWLDQPGGVPLEVKQPLTINQFMQLRVIAGERGQTIEQMLSEDLTKVAQAQANAPAAAVTKP